MTNMPVTPVTYVPRADGFSLIEALVALVITSILLLVFMKMASVSLMRTQESRTRAFAAHQMQSMAASVSANRPFWVRNSSAPVTLTLASVANAPDCETRRCQSEPLAHYEMANWAKGLTARLTAPVASVTCAELAGVTSCAIELSWHERGAPSSNAPSQLTLRFVP